MSWSQAPKTAQRAAPSSGEWQQGGDDCLQCKSTAWKLFYLFRLCPLCHWNGLQDIWVLFPSTCWVLEFEWPVSCGPKTFRDFINIELLKKTGTSNWCKINKPTLIIEWVYFKNFMLSFTSREIIRIWFILICPCIDSSFQFLDTWSYLACQFPGKLTAKPKRKSERE